MPPGRFRLPPPLRAATFPLAWPPPTTFNLIYRDRAWPGRLPAPIIPRVNASAVSLRWIRAKADRRAGRGGSHQPRQQNHAGTPYSLGWSSASASGALHGNTGRHPAQPGDPRLLSTGVGGGQIQEGGDYRMHAEAPGNTQQHGQKRRTLASAHRSELTSKTVALPPPITLGFGQLEPAIPSDDSLEGLVGNGHGRFVPTGRS